MLVLVLITKLEYPCAELLCLFCKHLAKILFAQFKIPLCTVYPKTLLTLIIKEIKKLVV